MAISTQHTTPGFAPWRDPGATPQIRIMDVAKRYGDFAAVDGVSLDIYRGELFALVGASGCGKTTLLRMLAGFVKPTAGRILIDGADLTEAPPYERPVNMMFQSYALFPHMSVAENIAYGLKRDGVDRAERSERVSKALDRVQLGHLGDRKPHQLSGGQRQRVALARALVKRPKVLLLDEPLSALDKKLRESTQFELMDLQHDLGITFVVVTHDQDEAMALATRVAVMDRGRVQQVGTPAEVYEYPTTRFVADFFGSANLIDGVVEGSDGETVTVATATAGRVCARDARRWPHGTAVTVAFRPEKAHLSPDGEPALRGNAVRGEVWDIGYLGSRSTYVIKSATGQKLTVVAQNDRRTVDWSVNWGDRVLVEWPADSTVVLEA